MPDAPEDGLAIPVTAGGTMTFLDEDTLVLDNGDDALDLSAPSEPTIVSHLSKLTDSPLSLAFTPEGDQVGIRAVSSVELRDVSAAGIISPTGLKLTAPVTSHITDVAFLDHGGRLAGSDYSGRIWRWDLDPQRAATTICAETGALLTEENAVALAPSLPSDAPLCG